ncbi:MAG: helix-hairpin-helix domain-containing protein [Pseudomonadota bacterium]
MGDERGTANESENLAGSAPAEPARAVAPKPVALPPRPVSVPPRPASSSVLPSRPPGSPPPLPQRGLLSTPLPPPGQQPPLSTPVPSLTGALQASAPAASAAPLAARQDAARIQALLAEVMSARQELTEKTTALRKVTAERDTLRARLAAAEAKMAELSSAFRAETQLRSDAVEAHAATSSALRARVAELESALADLRKVGPEPVGLRRIRGIGPAYERALRSAGITTVTQVAELSAADIARIAPQIKAQPERILRDDWVGQARRLLTG